MQATTVNQAEFEQAVATIVGSKFPVEAQRIVAGWEIDIPQLQARVARDTAEEALEWLREVMANPPVMLEIKGELINMAVALFQGRYYIVNRNDFKQAWIQYGELIAESREVANEFLEEEFGCSLA
jgi:hypothetical protein